MTPIKIMKWVIALGPASAQALKEYQSDGFRGVLRSFTVSYTGYNIDTNGFQIQDALKRGYAPLFGAWLFGKVASRVLR